MNRVRLSELMEPARRPIETVADASYTQIGVRSFGKGLFVKEPVTGSDLGNKKVFEVRDGDLVLNIVFAWEGAVGLVGPNEDGLCGSHRFPAYRATDLADVRFLRLLLLSSTGIRLLGECSPGSAGRNRTLNRKALLASVVAVPDREVQTRIADICDAITAAECASQRVSEEALVLRRAVVEERVAQAAGSQVQLGELATPVRDRMEPADADVLPYVGLEHVHADCAVVARHGDAESVRSTKTLFKTGDVLFGKLRPYLRKSSAAPFAGICSTDILALRPSDDVLPEYLALLLGSRPVIERAVATAAGTRMPRTNWKELAALEVPVPSAPVQRDVVEAVRGVEAVVATRAQSAAVLGALRSDIAQAAAQGAFP